jgi:signal transduction histidine kinase
MPRDAYGIGANYLTMSQQTGGECSEEMLAAASGIRSILEGKSETFEMEYPCHSPHEQRWFVMRALPFEGNGPRRVVVSHEDITARKTAERLATEQLSLREAVAGMEHVLGVVGHELRTPLAALRAISEFLTADGARQMPEADGFLNQITREVCRMSDTVNNILEAARLNSGRARWAWSSVDLATTVEEAIRSIQPLIDSKGIKICNHVDQMAGTMTGDSEAIRRLLINLLSNALKYTSEGQIELFSRSFVDATGHWIDLVVRDTGCGIAPELTARLGEAFALNAGVVGTNHIGGAGLGLAICKGIAAAHGGELKFESVQGRGTTVTARIRADLQAAVAGDTIRADVSESLAA